MSADVLVTVLVGLALVVGALGTIIPVLPGSLLVLAALLVWALVIGGAPGWVVFAAGGALAVIGMSASWLLAGRKLKQQGIPQRSVLWGAAAGIVGMFVIPVLGLFVGFAAGLYASEWYRLRDSAAAWSASRAALISLGKGMLVEFTCACLVFWVWAVGALVYYLN